MHRCSGVHMPTQLIILIRKDVHLWYVHVRNFGFISWMISINLGLPVLQHKNGITVFIFYMINSATSQHMKGIECSWLYVNSER